MPSMGIAGVLSESLGTLLRCPRSVLPYLAPELALSGLGIALLRVLYHTAGYAKPYLPFAAIAISFIASLFVTPFFYGMYTELEVQKLSSRKASVLAAYNDTKRWYSKLFWAGLINTAVYLAIIAAFAAAVILTEPSAAQALLHGYSQAAYGLLRKAYLASPIAIIITAVLFLSCVGAAAVLLFQYVPAIIVEGMDAAGSIVRSFAIGTKNFFSIAALLSVFIIVIATAYAAAWSMGILFGMLGAGIGAVAQFVLPSLAGSIVYPWYIISMTSFYNRYVNGIGGSQVSS
ncbi:MAG: hypothetical protein QXF01_02120 [Candidatus Micrarchaeaceae archaeon]